MASSELSNFQRFQEILTKRPLTTVPENNNAESESLTPPPRVPSWEGSEQDEVSPIIPFLRQIFRWDQQLQLYVENRESPDEDWAIWEALTTNETPRAWVRYQRVFDKLGVKAIDRLVIRADSEILDFLNGAEDLPRSDDLFNGREGGHLTRGAHKELSFYRRSNDAIIDEKLFRELFFRYEEIKGEMATTSSEGVRRVLSILTKFLDYTFSAAKEGYQDACHTGQVPFHHVWTLFRPGDIVYEKLPVAPFQDSYEQCFSVHSSEDSVSRYDGTKVLCLTLTEIAYRSDQANISGPGMVWTTRYIREYEGGKQITTEDLGIVPFSMMAPQKRDAIKTTLIERGRRFLQISKLPFSFWNYKGPYTIVHPLTGHRTIEEARLSLESRRWQKHTHENVVTDIATSNMHFKSRFGGAFDGFHWSEHNTKQDESRAIPSIEFSKDGSTTEVLLLICRGYLPGYLLSSSVYAVGILISELRPPIWAPQPLPSSIASLMPDTAQWHGLVQGFLGRDEDLEAEFGRRQARGSGLVLALEGSKIIVRKVANQISDRLERPVVCIDILDGDLNFEVATKAALRWGAILFVEFRNVSSDRHPYRVLDLRNHASFYPSVMLISCNSTKELGDHCEEMIDSVISCRLPSKDELTALWELAITEQTPGLSTEMSGKRLSGICQFLAQLEIRETRMKKILNTAKRMAVTERVQFSLKHVVAVIRLSVTADKLGEFESVARMEMHKLGYD